jgi:hypothetical protein
MLIKMFKNEKIKCYFKHHFGTVFKVNVTILKNYLKEREIIFNYTKKERGLEGT